MRSRNVPRSLPAHVRRRRRVSGALAGTLLLAACGGSDDTASSPDPSVELSDDGGVDATDGDPTADAAGGDEAAADGVTAPAGTGFVDLVGPDVVAAANIGTNLLPDVVIDDLTNDRKVNFRNLVPQEKPILLWMYAPH